MATRYWLGGGGNNANDPNDWTPAGKPEPGDTLYLQGSDASNDTINIYGGDVAGATIVTGYGPGPSQTTINLDHNAVVNLTTLAQVSGEQSTTINTSRSDTLTETLNREATQTINIGKGSTLSLGLSETSFDNVTVNSAGHGALVAEGTVGQDEFSTLTINAPVIGSATFDVNGTTTFNGSVGSGDTVDLTNAFSDLQLNHPLQFIGSTHLSSGEIDLAGLTTADSYYLQNNELYLYAGNNIIESLNFVRTAPFTAERTATGVSIYTSDAANPPAGTVLPLHFVQ